MPRRTLLICDIDNTLCDWNGYYATSFRALVHVAARELGATEDDVYDQLKAIHQEYRSIEYPFSVQLLPSAAHLATEEKRQLIKRCRGAFLSVRKSRERAFDGVRRTLEWAMQQEITLVAVSNAPIYQAYRRLERLRLRPYFDGLVAWRGWDPRPTDDPLVGDWMPVSVSFNLPWHAQVEYEDLKPSPIPYTMALKQLDFNPEHVWVVGDSLSNDIAPAIHLGFRTVWAKYGASIRQKDLDTLLRVTDWTDAQLRAAKQAPAVVPEHVIDSFDELTRLLPATQEALFELGDTPWH